VCIPDRASHEALRFPVQVVLRPQTDEHHDYRGYAGTVAAGLLTVGAEVVTLPGGRRTTIAAIDRFQEELEEAGPGTPVAVRLADQLDLGRGTMLADSASPPVGATRFTADICWMDDESSLFAGQQLWLKHTTRRVRCRVESLDDHLDVATLERAGAPDALALNEIGRVTVRTTEPIFADPYAANRTTGSFILVSPVTYRTVAAGMIRELPDAEGEMGDRYAGVA
jgi:bifunctional enzyme CysN/CysC